MSPGEGDSPQAHQLGSSLKPRGFSQPPWLTTLLHRMRGPLACQVFWDVAGLESPVGLNPPLGSFPSQICSVSLILMAVPIQAGLESPTAKPRHCPPSPQAGGSPVALEAHHREENLSWSPSYPQGMYESGLESGAGCQRVDFLLHTSWLGIHNIFN